MLLLIVLNSYRKRFKAVIAVFISLPEPFAGRMSKSEERKPNNPPMSAARSGGLVIDVEEAGYIKALRDGVTVKALLDDAPLSLQLTFRWPELPSEKIDFVLVSLNKGYSFLAAFRYGTFGLTMAYSENSNPSLIKPLAAVKKVTIVETDDRDTREYECELKHSD